MPPRPWAQQHPQGTLRLHHLALPGTLAAAGGSEALFWHLFGSRGGSPAGSEAEAAEDTWWLDSATTDRGRFSFMGDRGGRLWRRIEYRLPPPPADGSAVDSGAAAASVAANGGSGCASLGGQGTLVLTAADGSVQQLRTDFLGWLGALLERQRCRVRWLGGRMCVLACVRAGCQLRP